MSEAEWLDIFGDNLDQMLYEANMTQRELSETTFINESTISRYISKQRIPNIKHIISIAYALDCSVGDLIDFGDLIE